MTGYTLDFRRDPQRRLWLTGDDEEITLKHGVYVLMEVGLGVPTERPSKEPTGSHAFTGKHRPHFGAPAYRPGLPMLVLEGV